MAPSSRRPSRPIALLLASLCAAPLAHGQGTASGGDQGVDQGADLDAILEQNADLLERVAELEAWRDDELYDEAGAGLLVTYGDVSVNFQIFGDVGFGFENPEPPGRGQTGFVNGSIDFFANVQFGDHFRVISETVALGTMNDGVLFNQPRLSLAWIPSDEFYAKIGTDHSHMSRWNELYHHGFWLDTTVRRPLLVRFEPMGGVLPLHRTGLYIGGAREADIGRLTWYGTVSNGRGETPADRQRTEDADDHKAIDAGFSIEPEFLDDVRIGFGATYDTIPVNPASADPLRMQSMDEWIGTSHVDATFCSLDVLAEFAYIRHEAFTGQSFHSNGGYLQVSKTFDTVTPYTRLEYLNMGEGDPFYAPMKRDQDTVLQTVGVRVDVHTNIAVKAEIGVGKTEKNTGAGIDEDGFVLGLFQLAWIL